MRLDNLKLGIIGLGYVGLPLAAAFGKIRKVTGFDININRIDQLKKGYDQTLELTPSQIKESKLLEFTSNFDDLSMLNCFIVTVPTPINELNKPDLNPMIEATKMVARILKHDDIVIYESTVYPGLTEEICVPILEEISSLKLNIDFSVGYSPERINPGDQTHQLENIVKITSGSNKESAEIIDQLYNSIIVAGTHKASSIKVAEAAKVIENTQRDVNIALINELSKIFDLLNIDTEEVLDAAKTKWNFLPFAPGLVGGHCIGVDPYYLTYKAQELNYHPEIILAGRKINDQMSEYVAMKMVEKLNASYSDLNDLKILIMGLTFKENCPDTRNSKVFDLIQSLQNYDLCVDVYDPWIKEPEKLSDLNISFVSEPARETYNGIIMAVAHDCLVNLGINTIRSYGVKDCVLYDLKHIFDIKDADMRL